MMCTLKIKPNSVFWCKYYRVLDRKFRGTYRSSECFGKLKSPWVMRSTKLRGILWICSQLNMTKSYLKTKSVLSVIKTRRSFSLFQWSTLKKKIRKSDPLVAISFIQTYYISIAASIVVFSRNKHTSWKICLQIHREDAEWVRDGFLFVVIIIQQ